MVGTRAPEGVFMMYEYAFAFRRVAVVRYKHGRVCRCEEAIGGEVTV